ncbi:MAG TPA: hypothetical protein VG389_28640 [Myxococcota bacterium]|jgi:hypothetical protein|nr:hypothetical protein [Myxococcota bacterium]
MKRQGRIARTAAATGLAALAAAMLGGGAALAAAAAATFAAYSGKVVNLREAPPSSLEGADMLDWVKSNAVTGRAQTAPGEWTLNLFTVFKSKPGMTKIMLLMFDKKDPDSIKKKEPVEALEIAVRPDVTNFMTSVNVTEDMGFNVGHHYLIRFVAATSKTERLLSEGEIALVKDAPKD